MSETLKSCPFCGGEACVFDMENTMPSCVRCVECGARIETDTHSGARADNAWNRRASGWISVDERLPEEEGEYLVARSGLAYGVATFAVSPGGAPSGIWSLPRVGHWQPLQPPEAP